MPEDVKIKYLLLFQNKKLRIATLQLTRPHPTLYILYTHNYSSSASLPAESALGGEGGSLNLIYLLKTLNFEPQ
jgi:hypothetical protein